VTEILVFQILSTFSLLSCHICTRVDNLVRSHRL